MDWEFYILNYIQDHIRNNQLDVIMPLISMLGAGGVLWVIMTVISLITKKHRSLGTKLAFSLITDLLVCNATIKPIVNRIRPYDLNSTVQLIVPPEIDPSFPSGHTFFAFSAATICFLYNKKLGIVMYLIAAMIAFSRLYLYIHFPTDVMCGAFFGTLTALLSWFLYKYFFEKKQEFSLEAEETEE